jgi:Transcriptional regulator, AbiEi antitoxin
MRQKLSTAGPRIASLAGRQHGVVTVQQLRAAGLDESAVRHVTLPAAVRRRSRQELQIHRSRTPTPRDVTRRHGVAVTTPARTIEDIRDMVEPYLFPRALRQAELAGHPVPHLGAVKRTRSDLELLFLTL